MEKTARGLGYAGLLPFAALTVAGITSNEALKVLQYFLAYSAVILSFLGGIHWGLAMQQGDHRSASQLATCMLPSLSAWISLTLPPLTAITLLIASYLLWWIYDRTAIELEWYHQMRAHLTFAVVFAHLIWVYILF